MSNDGGPAYPTPDARDRDGNGIVQGDHPGLSIRDWFAGQALAGLTSAHDNEGLWTGYHTGVAVVAYQLADAMIAARANRIEAPATTQEGEGMSLGLAAIETFAAAIGKRIASVKLDEDAGDGGALVIRFEDGTGLQLQDDGRSCCESRYMRTDDDLTAHVGATLIGGEVLTGPDVESEYGDIQETAFLHVRTSNGVVVVNTHNEHNGYYGGFWIVAKALAPETTTTEVQHG